MCRTSTSAFLDEELVSLYICIGIVVYCQFSVRWLCPVLPLRRVYNGAALATGDRIANSKDELRRSLNWKFVTLLLFYFDCSVTWKQSDVTCASKTSLDNVIYCSGQSGFGLQFYAQIRWLEKDKGLSDPSPCKLDEILYLI